MRKREAIADADASLLTSLGYRPGVAAADERLLELRHLAVDHLHPGRRHYLVSRGLLQRRRAAIGLGWPLCCLMSLAVAATMAQIASAFPTAGGLYHWAAILGGRGWGWLTAWFNLVGLVTVLAAINVGTYQFAIRTLGHCHPGLGTLDGELAAQLARRAGDHGFASRVQSSRHRLDGDADRFQRLLDSARRRGADRRRAGLCAGDRLRAAGHVHQLQRLRRRRRLATVGQHWLAVPARLSAAGLHRDRFRRFGPRGRRNPRRGPPRAARHRPFGASCQWPGRLDHALGRGHRHSRSRRPWPPPASTPFTKASARYWARAWSGRCWPWASSSRSFSVGWRPSRRHRAWPTPLPAMAGCRFRTRCGA